MHIETDRLAIVELTMEMARDIHENSLDDDTRKFIPDEVFETVEEARKTVAFLMSRYHTPEGPFVYAVQAKGKEACIGYVQLVLLEDGNREIGYHIGKAYTGKGYATEAVSAFLPVIAAQTGSREIYGICLKENAASCRVLEKCGFETVFEGCGLYQGEQREIVKSIWRASADSRALYGT